MNSRQEKLAISLSLQMWNSSEEEREAMARFIETELAEFVRRHFDAGIESVWDCTQASQWEDWRARIAILPEAKAENEAAGSSYSKAMKLFAGFLGSKYYRDTLPKPKKQKKENAVEPPKPTFVEGALVQQTVDKRERDPQVRKACIEKYGCRCVVCGFDFKAIYGEVGEGYIEVHHLQPISQTDGEHQIEVDDLRPLCANCHAMAHRRQPEPFSIEELKTILENARKQD